MSYRKAKIFIEDTEVGVLEETDNGYVFYYLDSYLKTSKPTAVSLTLPLQKEPYESSILFPFFDGLIPEGWLLSIVEKTWKIDIRDRMGLLLASCEDTIGNVSVRAYE